MNTQTNAFSTAAAAPGFAAAHPFLDKIRNFTPNWFASTMGTGIVFLVLASLPVHFQGQHALALTLWVADIVLWFTFALMFLARWVLFPETMRPMLHHPVQSMFLGTIPMGLAPLINGIALFAEPHFGASVHSLALGLWAFDAVLSIAVAIGVPYVMFTEQSHAFERVTAVLLLPIVAPEVAATTASTLASHMPVETARFLIGSGYVLWALSVPLAFSVLTMLFFRLVIHKLPHRDLGASTWLTLGPIGTGALGLLTLGQNAPAAFAGTALESVATVARDLGVIGGLMLWGVGLWWLAMAVLFVLRYRREGFPFNLGWWAFTFPLGVFTIVTFTLYRVTHFSAFEFMGLGLAAALGVLWVVVASKTIRDVTLGKVFVAPCLLKMNAA